MRNLLPSKRLKGLAVALASTALVASSSLFAQSESINGLTINPTSKGATANISKAALNPFLTVNIGDSLIKFQQGSVANGNAGVAYLNGQFWISKWASDSLCTMNAQGQVTSKFTIPGVTGVRSITTDGTSLYMGAAGSSIFVVDPVTKTRTSTITITGTTVGARMCAYDPTAFSGAGGFWIGNFTSDVVLVSKTGVASTVIPMATHGVSAIYGGAVDTVTAGGPYLYMFNQGATGALEQARIDVIAIPSGMPTGIFYTVTPDLIGLQQPNAAPIAGGLFITDQYSTSNLQVFGVMQGTPDILFGYDVVVPNCLNPTLPVASNATTTTVDLNWTSGGATIWNIEYGPLGFVSGTGTKISNITTKPYTLTGLSASTVYEFRVEDSCSAANNSFWSVKGRFATACAAVVAPYTQSFGSATFDPCITNYSSSNELWVLSQAYSPAQGGHGPATDNSGTGYFAYVDDSESPSSSDVTLQMPDIDISGLTNPELEFFHYSDRETGTRNATLYVTVEYGTNLDTVFVDSVNTNGWKRNSVNLSSLGATTPIKVRFIVDETNGTFYDDIAIDDISIKNAASFDVELLATNRLSEYTRLPFNQTDSIVFAAIAANIGADTLRNVKVNYTVKRNATVVYTDSSSITKLAPGANNTFIKVANYVPTVIGAYTVDYLVSHSNVDATPNNNSNSSDTLIVTDTTMARDNGIATGSLGIGAGIKGELGSVYEISKSDTLTSVTVFINNGGGSMTNQPLSAQVRSFSNGLPGSVLATTDTITYTNTGASYATLTFNNAGGYVILPADSFFVGVEEQDSNVTVGTTPTKFMANTNFVTFGTTPWTPNENFNFNVTYMIRPNFGTPRNVIIGTNEILSASSAIKVYPNPSNGFITLNITDENKIGNVQVEVYDITGKVVYNNNFSGANTVQEQIDLSSLNNGMYFLRTNINGNNTIQKLTIR